jgi:hypothetical protein
MYIYNIIITILIKKKSRIMAYLEVNKILSQNQFGFRPDIGTINALYNTSKFLINELD